MSLCTFLLLIPISTVKVLFLGKYVSQGRKTAHLVYNDCISQALGSKSSDSCDWDCYQ